MERKKISTKLYRKFEREDLRMFNEIALMLPESVENLQLPNPELATYWKDENERVFWIEGEITDALFEYSKQIIRINREDKNIPIEDRKPIKLFIDSPGGDLETTLAFVGLVGLSKTPVHTINAGIAYSGGGLILMSGHKRFAMPNSQTLIHSGSGGTYGTFEQTTEQMKNYKQLVEKMKNFIISHTNIDQKLFKKNQTKDWFITTEEQVSLGIVDKIVEDLDEIL